MDRQTDKYIILAKHVWVVLTRQEETKPDYIITIIYKNTYYDGKLIYYI